MTKIWITSFHDRLSRQVLQLERSVADITSSIELIMEKLGLQDKTKGNQTAGKLSTTKNDVSMKKVADICKLNYTRLVCLSAVVINRECFFFQSPPPNQTDETASDGSVLLCVDRGTKAEISRRSAVRTNSTFNCHMWLKSEKQNHGLCGSQLTRG